MRLARVLKVQHMADFGAAAGSQGDQVDGGSAGMQSCALFRAFSVAWWCNFSSGSRALVETIQQLGGWHSDTWQQHIQFPTAELASRTATVGQFPSRTMVPDGSGGSASSVSWVDGFNGTALQ